MPGETIVTPTEPVVTPTEPVVTTPVDTVVSTNVLVESLPEDLRNHERLAGVATVEDLAKRLVEAKIAPEIPAPDGYQLPQGIPAEVGQFAHENGLTQDQLNSVLATMKSWNEASDNATFQAVAEMGQNQLKEWGAEAPKNVELAKSGVAFFEAKHPGLRQLLNETGYGNHPLVMKMFADIGGMVKEGGFIASDNHTPANKKTAAERMFPSHMTQS